MYNSAERMNFIIEYISAYEEKIKLSNSNGLFDSAKLFEIFAIKICSLWFNQRFYNLNSNVINYPYVDLISEDNNTFVQVSTTKDVPNKIKTTLEKIRDSKSDKYSKINKVVFFVLCNETIKKVKDYVGESQIGDISFTQKDNLITTKDIINKAQSDIDFQIQLYNLLKKEFDSYKDNSNNFKEALEISNIGLNNIDGLINGEYEIDRSKLISNIKFNKDQFISIQGEAGSGKSVLCKKFVESEEYVLYARAERFTEESNINYIWNFNIKEVLEYLNGKLLIIFIDALEFIADNKKTKFELLQQLYEIVKPYSNVKILTSCRTCDKKAFIKLGANYSIHPYIVPDLTLSELLPIAKKYPVIQKMINVGSYSELLKSPFYINLIISKITNIDDIVNENQLRNYIWQNIICLKDKAISLDVKYNDVVDTIKSIVFERAKKFIIGISNEKLDSKILHVLKSEGIVTENTNTVRLKYDIFEDICFEQYFDRKFDECKGNYQKFFNEIESLGRCVYRRYQIWISNKILTKSTREKFLHSLIFSDSMPQNWRKQTEIGLVKSRFSSIFFKEKGYNLIERSLLEEFINVTNLYAFESNIYYSEKGNPNITLTPCGSGRSSLILLIAENNIFKTNDEYKDSIIKLCMDYAKQRNKKESEAVTACEILKYYISILIELSKNPSYYKLEEEINLLLMPIYQMAEYSKDWIKQFWNSTVKKFDSENRTQSHLWERIIDYALKNTCPELALYTPQELCNIAEWYWTHDKSKIKNNRFTSFIQDDSICFQYGLNENAENYKHSAGSLYSYKFFCILFEYNLKFGFDWAISFVNKAVLYFAEKHKKHIINISLRFLEDNTTKNYLGNSNMWLAGIKEYEVPTLIGDLIFILKNKLIRILDFKNINKDFLIRFSNYVKNSIYQKSNNVILLTIIAAIGIHYERELPGYALELITSLDIVAWDISRCAFLSPNPHLEFLEKQIYLTVGLPEIKKRYEDKTNNIIDLRKYVTNLQLYGDSKAKERCVQILDYLYSITPDDTQNAMYYLQIQNMDLRKARAYKVSDNTYALIPTITGESAKIVKDNDNRNAHTKLISSLIEECNKKISSNQFDINDNLKAIDAVSKYISSDNSLPVERILVQLIAFALDNQDLECEKRSKLCNIWIEGITNLFVNGNFSFDLELSITLFQQIDSNAEIITIHKLKKLILDCLLYKGQNGKISKIADYAKVYLRNHPSLSKAVFNTIIKLSENEMDHQKFNANYLKQYRKNEDFSFIPNMQPKLSGVDYYISEDGKKTYEDKSSEIINKYLYNNESLELTNIHIDNYDIETICYISNCGLTFEDPIFTRIIREILLCIIYIWKNDKQSYGSREILNVYNIGEVMDLFQREMFHNFSTALNILFDDIDFSKFTNKTIEFYQDIFGDLYIKFFDSHSDFGVREKCKKILYALEEKISSIDNEKVRIELYKSLTFSDTHYTRGDWSQCGAGYSYDDKVFLNNLFNKYGKYHLKDLFVTIYELRIDELLPEILISVCNCIKNADSKQIAKLLGKYNWIVDMVIIKSFLNFNDAIKQDEELTKAYEDTLEMLIEFKYEKAAVILDEFRIH